MKEGRERERDVTATNTNSAAVVTAAAADKLLFLSLFHLSVGKQSPKGVHHARWANMCVLFLLEDQKLKLLMGKGNVAFVRFVLG